jgi:hypothetical protein
MSSDKNRPVRRRTITEQTFADAIGESVASVRRQRYRGELEYIQLSANRIAYWDDYPERLLAQRTVKPAEAQS